MPGTPRLLIPLQGGNYLAHDTRDVIPYEQEPYNNIKVNVDPEAGWIFNSDALIKTKEDIIFAVEDEFDAMSIEEVGGVAVGLGGISNARSFLNQLRSTPPLVPIIVAFDPEKGECINKAAADLAEEIKALGYEASAIDSKLLIGNCKDANEALLQNRAALQKAVKDLTKQYRKTPINEKQELLDNLAYTALHNIVNNIRLGVEPTCLTTGINAFDKQLGGGMYPGLYVIGAPSSLGKSTLVMQIADHVAQYGTDVMVFSLEMSRDELVAKSLSRITAVTAMKNGLAPKEVASTARDFLAGHKFKTYSDKKRELIKMAANTYEQYAQRIVIYECDRSFSVESVTQKVNDYIKTTGRKPLVIVDYMQILAPISDHMTDKQAADATVKGLYNLRRAYDLTVIAVSSFSRSSYDTPASMSAFKESGGIEYSADYLIGLQFHDVGSKNFNANEAKRADPRKMELILLKQRMGEICEPVELDYCAAYDLFRETI